MTLFLREEIVTRYRRRILEIIGLTCVIAAAPDECSRAAIDA